eukprot:Pgem_evm1s16475
MDIYNIETMKKYNKPSILNSGNNNNNNNNNNPPHVYTIANMAYNGLLEKGENQSILVT